MKEYIKHFITITKHRYYVRKFCFKCGFYKRGLLHDLSKYSFTEFFSSARYFQGTSSSIDAEKREKGYSLAWQHHKGRNPHHYEHWTDNYDSGTTVIPMPFEYMEEMIADWCAAGRTYQGKDWTFESQCEWWENKKRFNPSIHPVTIELLDDFFNKSNDMLNRFWDWKLNIGIIKDDYEERIKNVR
jgi:hypothetical protein